MAPVCHHEYQKVDTLNPGRGRQSVDDIVMFICFNKKCILIIGPQWREFLIIIDCHQTVWCNQWGPMQGTVLNKYIEADVFQTQRFLWRFTHQMPCYMIFQSKQWVVCPQMILLFALRNHPGLWCLHIIWAGSFSWGQYQQPMAVGATGINKAAMEVYMNITKLSIEFLYSH